MTPWTVACQGLCPRNSSGKNTGMGSHSLFQEIFLTLQPTQHLNLFSVHRMLLPSSVFLTHISSLFHRLLLWLNLQEEPGASTDVWHQKPPISVSYLDTDMVIFIFIIELCPPFTMHPSIHLPTIHAFTIHYPLFNHPSVIHSSIILHPSIHLSIHPPSTTNHLSCMHLSIQTSIHSSTHPSIIHHPSIHNPFIHHPLSII